MATSDFFCAVGSHQALGIVPWPTPNWPPLGLWLRPWGKNMQAGVPHLTREEPLSGRPAPRVLYARDASPVAAALFPDLGPSSFPLSHQSLWL